MRRSRARNGFDDRRQDGLVLFVRRRAEQRFGGGNRNATEIAQRTCAAFAQPRVGPAETRDERANRRVADQSERLHSIRPQRFVAVPEILDQTGNRVLCITAHHAKRLGSTAADAGVVAFQSTDQLRPRSCSDF